MMQGREVFLSGVRKKNYTEFTASPSLLVASLTIMNNGGLKKDKKLHTSQRIVFYPKIDGLK